MEDLPDYFLERTATLDEVLGPEFVTVAPSEAAFAIDETIWNRWELLVSDGDEDRFLRRIEWAGWDPTACKTRLKGFRRRPESPLPDWALRAQKLLSALTGPPNSVLEKTDKQEGGPPPFEELVMPIVAGARRTLEQRLLVQGFASQQARKLSNIAAKSLCETLVDLLGPVLFSLFQQHRQQLASQGNTSIYSAFVDRMRLRGYRQLFEARPVLLRLLIEVQDQWLESSQKFLTRLRDDVADAAESLLACPVSHALEDIDNFEFGLSDPHNGGQTVAVIVFRDGQRLVYKPKDLRSEANLAQLLTLMRAADYEVDLRVPRCLPKEGYGWMEFIQSRACNDHRQVEAYYWRAGAWLALFHILDGSDLHDENLIACGDHPVPVDFEVLFQGGHSNKQAEDAFQLAKEKIRHTVLAVGMLPTYSRDHNKRSVESGGLLEGRSSFKTLVWREVNTDSMKLDVVQTDRLNRTNLPRIGEVIQEASDFQEVIVSGFESCMNLLMRLRDLGALAPALEGFRNLSFRKVYRPTYFYYFMLDRLRDFKNWRSGLAWSIEAEFLYRLVDWRDTTSGNYPGVAMEEKRALLGLNIPFFTKAAVENPHHEPDDTNGFSLVCSRISILTSQDVNWESRLIRLALAPLASSRTATAQDCRAQKHSLNSPRDIAEFVAMQAIRHRGTAAWLGLDWHAELGKSQLVVLGQDFYNGNGGIAIFLAAAARLLNRVEWADLAYEAVAPLREHVKKGKVRAITQGNEIGCGVGLTSHVYTLTVLSDLLGDARLRSDAGLLVDYINRDLISSDKNFDVLAGTSGAILALLKHHQSHRDAGSLDKAIACGDHLVSELRNWRETVQRPQPESTIQANGFAHGAAGMSLALFRLASVTGRDAYRQAAQHLVDFENASFSANANNWPDLRSRDLPESTWACQWCHGAGGIGLSRLSAAFVPPTSNSANAGSRLLLEDVERAIAGVSRIEWPGPIDTLCCGNSGNIEFLREAGVRLGRPALTHQADKMLEKVMNRAKAVGDYAWSVGDASFNLGLFRGVSGIGYSMLRAAYPRALPNVLIWE